MGKLLFAVVGGSGRLRRQQEKANVLSAEAKVQLQPQAGMRWCPGLGLEQTR